MKAPGHPAPHGAQTVHAAGAVPLIGFYMLYFGTVGIILPFLPAWFKSEGIPASQVGLLLALQPAMLLTVPPLWGWLADRFGRADRVLTLVATGAALGFLPLLWAQSLPAMFVAMALYAFFASAITTLVDSLALQRVTLHGGAYARIRLFGSLGFVLSSTAFGLLADQIDRRTVWVPLALMGGYAVWSLTLRARSAALPARSPLAGWALLRHRDLALMLAACGLHWLACAPFHGNFGIHVIGIGLDPWVIGISAGVGVVAEIGVMFAYPQFARRIAPRHVLFISFIASALRWAGMAVVDQPGAIVALSVLHGLSFGSFYVAAVGFIAARVPDALRASGQGLLVSITFGLGGLVGYLGAGVGYEWLGGHRLFAVAAGLELLPAVLILFVRDAEATRSHVDSGAQATGQA